MEDVGFIVLMVLIFALSSCSDSKSTSSNGCHYEYGDYNPITGAYLDKEYVCEDDTYEEEDYSPEISDEEYQQDLEEQLEEEQEENERLQEELEEEREAEEDDE